MSFLVELRTRKVIQLAGARRKQPGHRELADGRSPHDYPRFVALLARLKLPD